jgi:hypothetical protein
LPATITPTTIRSLRSSILTLIDALSHPDCRSTRFADLYKSIFEEKRQTHSGVLIDKQQSDRTRTRVLPKAHSGVSIAVLSCSRANMSKAFCLRAGSSVDSRYCVPQKNRGVPP